VFYAKHESGFPNKKIKNIPVKPGDGNLNSRFSLYCTRIGSTLYHIGAFGFRHQFWFHARRTSEDSLQYYRKLMSWEESTLSSCIVCYVIIFIVLHSITWSFTSSALQCT